MAEALIPEKTHLFDRIYEILWVKISDGEILPGQRLKDVDWAERLQVSRTPVREAMRKMQHDGILLPMANGGYQVRKLQDSEIVDLYRCRAALESLAAEDAASHATDSDVRKLTKIVNDCDAAIVHEDLRVAFDLNSRFHAAVIELSPNMYVKQTCESLRKLIHFYRSAVLRGSEEGAKDAQVYLSRLKIKQLHHRQILGAIETKNGALAAALMQHHVRETAEDLLPKPFAVAA